MHLLIMPILLPALAGMLLLLIRRAEGLSRAVSLLATALLVFLTLLLYQQAAGGDIGVYRLGDWPAPFAIVLVLDRLSALMLVLTAVLALPALLYAVRGDDRRGADFHALFQFQLMGLNGAFLTGDLFNLFVFFEILLIASYGLALHGQGRERVRAGLHYVVLNLIGSSLFLIALALIYGTTGTLNMADFAVRAASLAPPAQALLTVACLLLGVVFVLKAALFPLYFWLPATYAGATAGVAALFAIMTKVGIYVIARLYGLAPDDLAVTAGRDALWLMALVTLPLAALGVLAARRLRDQIGYLMVMSVGTLAAALAWGGASAFSALLFYTVHTTLISGGLFLLADLIAGARGPAADTNQIGLQPIPVGVLGVLFFVGAIAVTGLPPLSGFFAKVALLQAVPSAWYWALVLGTGLLVLVALSRSGATLIWRNMEQSDETGPAAPLDRVKLLAVILLLLAGPLLADRKSVV